MAAKELLCLGPHLAGGKQWIKNTKTSRPSPWSTVTNRISYSGLRNVSIKKRRNKQRSSLSPFCFIRSLEIELIILIDSQLLEIETSQYGMAQKPAATFSFLERKKNAAVQFSNPWRRFAWVGQAIAALISPPGYVAKKCSFKSDKKSTSSNEHCCLPFFEHARFAFLTLKKSRIHIGPIGLIEWKPYW